MRRAALVLFLAACGDAAPGTSVRLDVRYQGTWSLSSLEVAAGEERAEADVAPTVRVLVPDAWAAQPIELEVVGKRAGEPWAAGRVAVTPRLGEEVRAEVTLARLPCGAWCTPGTMVCSGDGTTTCEQDGDECLEWSTPIACPPAAPSCSFGQCATTCLDECASGESRCAGGGLVQRCGQADSDACRDWLPALACRGDESCSAGECRGECVDECQEGTVACAADGRLICGDRDADGCREWGPPEPCPPGETCSAGACSATCTDDCEGAICEGSLYRPCGQFDQDVCTDRALGVSCDPVDACQEGACTEAGCVSAPRVCESPPPSICLDGDTLRTYDLVGACQDGVCAYSAHDRDCPNCPSCDACAGVTCDDPPSICHASPGSCSAGSCDYGHADGVDCDDGDACTEADECAGGVCSGEDMTCTTPPEPTCVNGLIRRVHASPGACADGACAYPFVDSICPSACVGGACGCAEAICKSETLGTGTFEGGRDVAIDATDVYWATSDGRVMRRTRGAGEATVFAGDQVSVNRLALDATHVYWASYDGGAVRRRAKSGGVIETITSGSAGYVGLDVDATHVYWTHYVSGNVQRRAKTGGAIESISTSESSPARVAVDATHVYWTNQGGKVRRRPKGNTGPAVDFAFAFSARDLVLDGDTVYFTDGFYAGGTVSLNRASKSDGSVHPVTTGVGITGIAVDTDWIYWGSDDSLTPVQRKPKGAGSVEPLRTPGNVFDVAIDAGHLYWVTRESPYQAGRLSRCACNF